MAEPLPVRVLVVDEEPFIDLLLVATEQALGRNPVKPKGHQILWAAAVGTCR